MSADPLIASASQTVGPFFHIGPGATDRFGRMTAPDASREHITLRILVLDGDGAPVNDALVELLQANAGFGRLGTKHDGTCVFETIRPSAEAGQAAHIDLCLFARGLLRHLYTRIYFEADPALDGDPLLSLVTADRRDTLVARRVADGAWQFTVRLQGAGETVFFDL